MRGSRRPGRLKEEADARELILAAIAAARPALRAEGPRPEGPRPERLRDLSTDDVVLATGLTAAEAELLLPSIAREYGARVAATGKGELLWRFPARLVPRSNGLALGRAFRRLGEGCGRAALAVLKAAIGIGYSFWALVAFVFLGLVDRGRATQVEGRKLSFYSLVFSYVFGGPDPDADRESRAGSEFLSWAASRRGLVSASEYALRSGLRLEEAEEAFALFAAEYDGSPRALGEGILAWFFPAAAEAERPPPPSAPFRTMIRFSPNPPGWNLPAGLLGAVNAAGGALSTLAWARWATLAASGEPVPSVLEAFAKGFGLLDPIAMLCCAGLLPLATGLLGLALPLGRFLRIAAENARRRRENARMMAGRKVLDSGGRLVVTGPEVPGRLSALGVRHRSSAPRAALDQLAAELGAEIDGLPGGFLSYRFTRLEPELEALEAARATLPRPTGRGSIVYDSGSPPE